MSETEVTVEKSVSGEWWRMEYKGRVDLSDTEPTDVEKRAFRKSVDDSLRARFVEANERVNGHRLMEGEAPNGNWRQ